MQVSEFIVELQRFLEEKGDMDILVNDDVPSLTFYDEDEDGPFCVVE